MLGNLKKVLGYLLIGTTLFNLSASSAKANPQNECAPKPFTWEDAFSAEFEPEPKEEIAVSLQLERVEENVAPVVVQVTESQPSSSITAGEDRQSIPEIIDRLGKRDLRKLCSPLGIQQKTNGTELTTELMKALIKRKFKENPFQVTQVIRERLPQLLPALSEPNQQQQIEKKAC